MEIDKAVFRLKLKILTNLKLRKGDYWSETKLTWLCACLICMKPWFDLQHYVKQAWSCIPAIPPEVEAGGWEVQGYSQLGFSSSQPGLHDILCQKTKRNKQKESQNKPIKATYFKIF